MTNEQGCWHGFWLWFHNATSYERVGCVLPTRLVYNVVLRGCLHDCNGTAFQLRWPRKWLLVEVIFCAIGLALPFLCYEKISWFITAFPIFVGIIAICRISEIICAYGGELQRLAGNNADGNRGPTMGQRAILAIISYPSLLLNWALVYFFLPSNWFHGAIETDGHGLAEMLYFSGITLTTVGYGDITPIHWLARFLSVIEVLSGMLVIVAALATYLAKLSQGVPPGPSSSIQ